MVVERFYANSDKLYFTKGDKLVDALTVSSLAKNDGVVFVSSTSDKSILEDKATLVQVGGMDKSIVDSIFENEDKVDKSSLVVGNDYAEINRCEEFPFEQYKIKATDIDGTDITHKVKWIGTGGPDEKPLHEIDTSVAGGFPIMFYVTLKDGRVLYEPGFLAVGRDLNDEKPEGNEPSTNINVNSEAYQAEYRKEFYKLINEHRVSKRVQPLTPESGLERWAYLKSKHMADNNYFDHKYNGQMIDDMYPNEGGSVMLSGENIFYSFGRNLTAKEFAKYSFENWRESDGHNRNMLSSSYNHVGVAVYQSNDGKIYATTDFGW